MSESPPSNATLANGLRTAVRKIFKYGNTEELTIRRIRNAVEVALNLEEGFFKSEDIWREKSKAIIQAEVDACTEARASSQPHPSQRNAERSSPPPSAIEESMPRGQSRKRASSGDGAPEKRRKNNDANSDDSRSDQEPARKSPLGSIRRGNTDIEADHAGPTTPETKSEGKEPKAEGSESEMSIVIDKKPKKRSRGRKPKIAKAPTKEVEQAGTELSEVVDAEPQKGKHRKSSSAKPQVKRPGASSRKTIETSTDPEIDEIKRLQSWLMKCGVRKVWGAYLAQFDTPKAKIVHLKYLLAELGMTGRYSGQKAASIKEERELQADLEAVQAGAKQWGKDSDKENHSIRPRRQLAKGLEGLDFLNDDDGEETN